MAKEGCLNTVAGKTVLLLTANISEIWRSWLGRRKDGFGLRHAESEMPTAPQG